MRTASVMKSGGSAVVTIPAQFCKRAGIGPGDQVEVFFPDDRTMAVRPVKAGEAERVEAVRALEEFAQRTSGGTGGGARADGTAGGPHPEAGPHHEAGPHPEAGSHSDGGPHPDGREGLRDVLEERYV